LIFEKSGVPNGSVLGCANGLDAGKVAEAVADAVRGAAITGPAETTANAAVARRMLRIMMSLKAVQSAVNALQPSRDLRKPEFQLLVESAASMASP
jgi:hypothetical protein